MKPKLLPPHSAPLHRLIQAATAAPHKDLSMIENIMRDEIFHSTLDWQTAEQLTDAARQAFERLKQDREFYDLSSASALAVFQKMQEAASK